MYLEIDNRRCSKSSNSECFQSVSKAAQYLAAAHARHALGPEFPFQVIKGLEDNVEEKEKSEYSNVVYFVIGVISVVVVGLLFGVLVKTHNKRARGITWFPEGFLRTNSGQRRRSRRRGPDGQEMRFVNLIF